MAGIPAGTVLLVAAGGVLMYAGFTSQNPLMALKSVSTGKPESVRDESGVDPASFSSTSGNFTGGGMAIPDGESGGIANVGYADVSPGGGLSALPRAAETYAGDRYSQAYRWSKGYSDCSSFVGKSLKLIGIKPPAGSTTASFLASREWKKIPGSAVKAGDIACAMNHVIICYGGGMGIGQQNKRVNVQRGKVSELMYGNTPFVYLRYSPGGSPAKVANV